MRFGGIVFVPALVVGLLLTSSTPVVIVGTAAFALMRIVIGYGYVALSFLLYALYLWRGMRSPAPVDVGV